MTLEVITDTKVLDKMLKDLKGDPTWILHDGVEYGIHQEFGFVHTSGNHVAAQPFMRPAVEDVRPAFNKGVKALIEGVGDAEDFVGIMAFKMEGIAKRDAPFDTGDLEASIMAQTMEEFLRGGGNG